MSDIPITSISFIRMGLLAHSIDCWAANLENVLPTMIYTILDDVVSPLNATIEDLAPRIAVCEWDQGNTE